MKYLLLGAAVAGILGYAWFGRGEANVYAMTPSDVYAALRAAPVQKGNFTPFGNLDSSAAAMAKTSSAGMPADRMPGCIAKPTSPPKAPTRAA